MTINGGKPHKVGDRGQRFEVTYFDPEADKRKVFGWSETQDGADAMVRSIAVHPAWCDPIVEDRKLRK